MIMCMITGLLGCAELTDNLQTVMAPGGNSEEAGLDGSLPAEEKTSVMGQLEHGPMAENIDANGFFTPLVYDGNEVDFDYYVKASGDAKNVGFLLFVDGIAQPYQIYDPVGDIEVEDNETAGTSQYLHTLQLVKDDEPYRFSFRFEPVTGRQGDSLELTVMSIYYPDFIPDMVERISYGGYHQGLSSSFPLFMSKDAVVNERSSPYRGTVTVSQEAVTDEFLVALGDASMREITADSLAMGIYDHMSYNDQVIYDSFPVADGQEVRINYKISGLPGIEYAITFYVDHHPVASAGAVSFAGTTEAGQVLSIDLMLEGAKLGERSTFYAVAVPRNGDEADIFFDARKTSSVVLYK